MKYASIYDALHSTLHYKLQVNQNTSSASMHSNYYNLPKETGELAPFSIPSQPSTKQNSSHFQFSVRRSSFWTEFNNFFN